MDAAPNQNRWNVFEHFYVAPPLLLPGALNNHGVNFRLCYLEKVIYDNSPVLWTLAAAELHYQRPYCWPLNKPDAAAWPWLSSNQPWGCDWGESSDPGWEPGLRMAPTPSSDVKQVLFVLQIFCREHDASHGQVCVSSPKFFLCLNTHPTFSSSSFVPRPWECPDTGKKKKDSITWLVLQALPNTDI